MRTRIALAVFTTLIVLAAAGVSPTAAQSDNRITGVVWADTTCDGVRQESEALLPNLRLTLRWAGSNGVIDGTDRDIEQFQSRTGAYRFTLAGAGEPYFVSVRAEDKPAGMAPAPFRQGDDPSRDNDLTLPLAGTSLWATPVFTMPADGALVTDLDLGLCAVTFNPEFTTNLPLVRR